MRWFTAYTFIFFAFIFFFLSLLSAKTASAYYPLECSSGEWLSGDCTGENYKLPVDCDPYRTGSECCAQIARTYNSSNPGLNLQGSCQLTCSVFAENPNFCLDEVPRFCCIYTTSTPTPTPTPTPPPTPILWQITGRVYMDKDKNGALDLPPDEVSGNANVSILDANNSAVSGSYTTGATGIYGPTLRMWQDGHFVSVTLNTVPAGCYVYNNTNPNNFWITADTTVNFPIVCGGPTPKL